MRMNRYDIEHLHDIESRITIWKINEMNNFIILYDMRWKCIKEWTSIMYWYQGMHEKNVYTKEQYLIKGFSLVDVALQ